MAEEKSNARKPRRRASIFSKTRKGSFWGKKKVHPPSIAQLLNDNDQDPRQADSAPALPQDDPPPPFEDFVPRPSRRATMPPETSFEPGINELETFKLAPPSAKQKNSLSDLLLDEDEEEEKDSMRIDGTPEPDKQTDPTNATTTLKTRLSLPNLDSFRNARRMSASSLCSERSVVSPPSSPLASSGPPSPQEPTDGPPAMLRRSSLSVPDSHRSQIQPAIGRAAKSHEGTFGVPQPLRDKYLQAMQPNADTTRFRRGSAGCDSVFSDSSILERTVTSLSIASSGSSPRSPANMPLFRSRDRNTYIESPLSRSYSPASPLKRSRHQVNHQHAETGQSRDHVKRRGSFADDMGRQLTEAEISGSTIEPGSPKYWLSQQAKIALEENTRLNQINKRLMRKVSAAYEELLRVESLPKQFEERREELATQNQQLAQELRSLTALNEQLQPSDPLS